MTVHFWHSQTAHLVDEAFCADLKRIGNLYLAISLEGFSEVNDLRRGTGVFAKVMHAMDLLKENGLVFGTSICYTSKNYKTVTSDEFIDMIVEKGCRYALYFHYMPVGNDASLELLPNPEQRLYIKDRVRRDQKYDKRQGNFHLWISRTTASLSEAVSQEEETTSISMPTAMLSHVYLSTTQEPTSVHTACLRF